MKKVFLAECSTPDQCLPSFQKVLRTFDDNAQLDFGKHVIVTTEEREVVQQRFHSASQQCNAKVDMLYNGNNAGK